MLSHLLSKINMKLHNSNSEHCSLSNWMCCIGDPQLHPPGAPSPPPIAPSLPVPKHSPSADPGNPFKSFPAEWRAGAVPSSGLRALAGVGVRSLMSPSTRRTSWAPSMFYLLTKQRFHAATPPELMPRALSLFITPETPSFFCHSKTLVVTTWMEHSGVPFTSSVSLNELGWCQGRR